jgi:Lrp/AsnC family transcriptional regulator, leucine-responsive regulatory protein
MEQSAPAELDAVDRRLVHRLAEDAAPDLERLGPEIGISAEDARHRYERLRRAGVITECVARISPEAVGVGLTAFLMVRLAQNAENYAVVRQMLGDLEAVEEAHAVSADFDWLLKVRTSSLAEVQTLVTQHLSLIPGFLRAQTCLVLDTACDAVNADRVRLAGR